MNLSLLILAAGMGSRYGSLKQLDSFGPHGETIMDYSIYDAINAGFNKVVFVIRKSFEQDFKKEVFSKYKGVIEVDYVFQELNVLPNNEKTPELRKKPWGTAHAVLMAKEVINEPFAVINADDFYGASSYKLMGDYLKKIRLEQNNISILLAYQLKNTLSEHGSVSRGICKIDDNGFLKSIVEHTQIKMEKNHIYSFHDTKPSEILTNNAPTSMNFMGFTPSIFNHIEHFFGLFLEKNRNSLTAEFFLPLLLSKIINTSKGKIKVLYGKEKWYGVTYLNDKEWVKKNIAKKINDGVYPNKLLRGREPSES